jgi:transposase-like protein
MTVQTVTRTIQLQEWASQIQDRLQSGQTVREWCERIGVAPKTYYYRLRRVREELENAEPRNMPTLGQPVFAALPATRMGGAAVTVRIGEHTAEIQDGADAETIERVLRALSRL